MTALPPKRCALPDNARMVLTHFNIQIRPFLAWLLSALLLLLSAESAFTQALPAEVAAALARAKVPPDAVGMLVSNALPEGKGVGSVRLNHRADSAMNPASLMKLVTTYAALDLMGPAYTWSTPVYLDGAVREGTLLGNVVVVGQGDPKLVLERLWLLLRRLQGLGVNHIAGDIVLDSSAFKLPTPDPAGFDGEPLRPYNASPDALLINYKSVLMTFSPASASGTARVQYDPLLAGVHMQATVPLLTGDCADYRAALQPDLSDPLNFKFRGGYPASCLEKVWPVAYADPASYAHRAVQGMWQSMGGTLSGTVRSGTLPERLRSQAPAFELTSATLGELVRDINKFSNNVMAQQVFLTLGRLFESTSAPQVGSFAASRAVLQRWWTDRISAAGAPVLDNGSGLSRQERISAQALGQLLQVAYRSPHMAELMASLPIAGVDGTLRRAKIRNTTSAHLKTGSLNNVVAVAGYVLGNSGKRYVLVALINHPNANAARAALEALVDWTAQDL